LSGVATLPTACPPPTANTPLNNFDVFAHTFAEQYISFDLRRADWARVVAEYRARVSARTTPAELFEILSAMIRPLADIHTRIEARKLTREFDAPLKPSSDRVVRGNIERFAKFGRRQIAEITDRRYLRRSIVSLCRGQWQYGIANDFAINQNPIACWRHRTGRKPMRPAPRCKVESPSSGSEPTGPFQTLGFWRERWDSTRICGNVASAKSRSVKGAVAPPITASSVRRVVQ
jgi:hypothetical protein